MGPVSAGNALVALDDRSIDGAADPPHVHTAPASEARLGEREEKGEGPRGSKRTANDASMVTDLAQDRGLAPDNQRSCMRRKNQDGRACGGEAEWHWGGFARVVCQI